MKRSEIKSKDVHETFKVKLKPLDTLREYGRSLGGDMSEDLSYFIKFDGKLLKSNEQPTGGFTCFTKHVLENGEEFLVVDHPNIITKREYEASKILYERRKNNNK